VLIWRALAVAGEGDAERTTRLSDQLITSQIIFETKMAALPT
jgi:hypothetical protein